MSVPQLLCSLAYFPSEGHEDNKSLAGALESEGVKFYHYLEKAFSPDYRAGLNTYEQAALEAGTAGSLTRLRARLLHSPDVDLLKPADFPDMPYLLRYLDEVFRLKSPILPLAGEIGGITLEEENTLFARYARGERPMLKVGQLLEKNYPLSEPSRLDKDGVQVSLVKMLGYSSLGEMTEHWQGKYVLDLGSGAGTLAKEFAALDLLNPPKIDNLDLTLRVPSNVAYIRDYHNKELGEYYGARGRKNPEALLKLFEDIDRKTILRYWTDLDFTKEGCYDLVASNRAFPLYSLSAGETRHVLQKLLHILKPGGEIRLAPIWGNEEKNDPARGLRSVLEMAENIGFSSNMQQIDFKGDYAHREGRSALCLVLRKPETPVS